MGKDYYISACVFTSKHPQISALLQKYARDRHALEIVRCCVPNYKTKEFTKQMESGRRKDWEALPDSADFESGDTVYSVCHNCLAILQETKPGVNAKSIWELILEDKDFRYPDYKGQVISIQDCWRSRENKAEQAAVRQLLANMNFDVRELPENHEHTDFCGVSLYRPAPPRNLKLAPRRFVDNAQGKFLPHTREEQEAIMKNYCQGISTDKVVTYCHYCLEGLKLGGKNARHLAELLFEPSEWH